MTYTEAERRVMDVLKSELQRRGRSTLCHAVLAERAGVGRSTVRQALGKAAAAGEIVVTRRQEDGLSNVVCLSASQSAGLLGKRA